jgi:hypothetical protein
MVGFGSNNGPCLGRSSELRRLISDRTISGYLSDFRRLGRRHWRPTEQPVRQDLLGAYESTFVAPETKDLNPLTFVIGISSNVPGIYTADGHLTETIAIGATTEPVSISFVATLTAGGDSLSVPSTTFVVGGYQFVTLPLMFEDVGSVSSSETQFLEANISAAAVPEPASGC